MKIHIRGASLDKPDKGDGGIRRVVEAQVKHLPNYGFEIVNTIDKADIVATHAAEAPDVPVDKTWVVHTHGLYWSEYQWPGWGDRVNAAVIDAMKMCDHVTAPSEWVAYALKRGMWLKPTVLYHGIEPEMWEPGENKGYVLWNKARTDSISDPRFMNILAMRCPDIDFISTFGDDAPNVTITGKKNFEDAIEDIKNAGVYLATTRETMGIGTLEAMACGVPILGWNWGGQAEIIEHKKTGWLAPVGNYDSLKQGLYWCLENRAEAGNNARRTVMQKFTWKKVMASYANLYTKLVERQTELNKAPKVSINVPCHNLGHLLHPMVESVKAQTMTDWEMTIVDDASTDNSYNVARGIAQQDKRIKVTRSKENLKLPGALNLAFSKARGRYCMNLDPDNMIPPSALKTLTKSLNHDRRIHIVYGKIKFVLEDGVTPDPITNNDTGISGWPPDFNAIAQLRHMNQIPSTCLYRREVLERTGGYRDRARVGEDAEHWCRAVSYGFNARKVTDEVTFIYRYRPDSKSRDEDDGKAPWTSWYPWARDYNLTPWGFAAKPPAILRRKAWPVPSCEPALVTVIIPVGPGHEKYVIDALDSVEGQTFRDWNVIVVNDTGKKLTVPHPWVQIIDTEGKTGPAHARNIGVEASTTQAFMLLDADDIMEPHCMNLMYGVWKERGGCVYSKWYEDYGPTDIRIWNPPEWDCEKLLSGNIFPSCAMYTKSDWEEVGGFDTKAEIWEDWIYEIDLALNGVCATKIDRPLFTYRHLTGTRRSEGASDKKRYMKYMYERFPQLGGPGGRELLKMGCGSCGNSKPKTVLPSINTTIKNVPKEGATLLEYLEPKPKHMFVGKETGTKYYFGNDQSHVRGFVYDQDVAGFLAMNCPKGAMFRIVELTEPTHQDTPVMAT